MDYNYVVAGDTSPGEGFKTILLHVVGGRAKYPNVVVTADTLESFLLGKEFDTDFFRFAEPVEKPLTKSQLERLTGLSKEDILKILNV